MERKSFFHIAERFGKWTQIHWNLLMTIMTVIVGIVAIYAGYTRYVNYEERIKPDVKELAFIANEIYEKGTLKSIATINNKNKEYKFEINATINRTSIEVYSKVDDVRLVKFIRSNTNDNLEVDYVISPFNERLDSVLTTFWLAMISGLLSVGAISILFLWLLGFGKEDM